MDVTEWLSEHARSPPVFYISLHYIYSFPLEPPSHLSTSSQSTRLSSLCCAFLFFLVLGYLGLVTQRRQWQPTPVLLPGKTHGRRSLVGCSPGGLEESDTTEWLHFHFSLSCIGEGNGNPLQCSCLENPRDGGAWWPAVYGVAQSRT